MEAALDFQTRQYLAEGGVAGQRNVAEDLRSVVGHTAAVGLAVREVRIGAKVALASIVNDERPADGCFATPLGSCMAWAVALEGSDYAMESVRTSALEKLEIGNWVDGLVRLDNLVENAKSPNSVERVESQRPVQKTGEKVHAAEERSGWY